MTVKCFRFLRFPSLLFACMNAAGNFFSLYCSPHPLCPFSTRAATSLEVALNWTSPDPMSYCLLAQGSCLTLSRLSLFYGNFKIQVERFQNTEMGEKGGREDKCFSCIGCDMQNWRALWNSRSSLWIEEQTKPFDSEGKTEDLEEGRGRIKTDMLVNSVIPALKKLR